jgi:uncharacterized C2H2 Zn-finger protein
MTRMQESQATSGRDGFARGVYGVRDPETGTRRFADAVYGTDDDSGYASPEEHFDDFAKECRRLIRQRFDNLIIIDGTPGVGKSCLGLNLARAIDEGFDLANCAYSSHDVRALYRGVPPGAVILYDEAVLGLLSQGGHRDPELRAMIQMLSIVRVKRVTMILCLPSILLLDSFVKGGRARFWLNVHTRGLAKPHRVWRGARYRTSMSRLPFDSYEDLNPIGFPSLGRTSLWKKYEQKKIERVDQWFEETELDPEGKLSKCPRCGKIGWKRQMLMHICSGAAAAEPTESESIFDGGVPERGIAVRPAGRSLDPSADRVACPKCGERFRRDSLRRHGVRAHPPETPPSLLT